MHEGFITVNKTARYSTLGKLNEQTKQVWIVLHGYAQLAKDFINPFKVLLEHEIFFVAPEAMHRFYVKGFSGSVGATWMTKEAREHDIQDNINFLNTLTSHLKLSDYRNCKIVLLGFSQGVATATRWFANTDLKLDALVMYAGEIAAEFRTMPIHPKFKEVNIYLVYGNSDPLLPAFAPDSLKTLFSQSNVQVIQFNGGHEISSDTLLQIAGEVNG